MGKRKNFVRELREAAGLSRPALAARVGCHPNTIVKIECGGMHLTDTWVYKISDALGCHPADLWDGGPERLKPREREVVAAFRELSETQQAAFHAGLSSLSPSGGPPAKRKPNGASRKTPPPPAKDG